MLIIRVYTTDWHACMGARHTLVYMNGSGIATNPDYASADQFSEKLSEGMIRGGTFWTTKLVTVRY
jgi:hypothetical protein